MVELIQFARIEYNIVWKRIGRAPVPGHGAPRLLVLPRLHLILEGIWRLSGVIEGNIHAPELEAVRI